MCKIRFKEYTIQYCTKKRNCLRDECKLLEDDITQIDKLIAKNTKDVSEKSSLKISRDTLKNKYDVLLRERASGAQIRSRAKWLRAR